MKKNNARFFVDNDSLFSHGTVIFFLLSGVFCLIGSLGRWDDRFYIISQVLLPAACCLVFVVFLRLFGRRLFWMTCFPAIAGLAFFVIKALTYGRILYSVISIVLSVLSVFLYTAVAFGWIKIKWPLIPIFILGFAFHVFVKCYNTLRNPELAVSFSGIMQEISVLFMILAMLFLSISMKNKRGIESLGLPKIKAPKVIAKKDSEKTETAAVPETRPEAGPEDALPAAEDPKLESSEPKELPEITSVLAEEKEMPVSEKAEKENTETEPYTGAEP